MANIPITANPTVYRYGQSGALPQLTADRSVSWTTNYGTVSPLTGASTYLTPPNFTRLITVTGTSGADSGNVLVQIFATFPLQPNYGYQVEQDDKTLISIAEDGTAVFRVKGDTKRTWQLEMPERPIEEYNTLIAFWNFHKKYTEFYYEDLALNTVTKVRFDSGLRITPEGPDRISMNCLVREV